MVKTWLGFADVLPICQFKTSELGLTVTGGVGETTRLTGTITPGVWPEVGAMVMVPV